MARQPHVVHEAAHEEDAPAARLEHVFGSQRIGEGFRFEAFALIANAHDEFGWGLAWRKREFDRHELARLFMVAVLDGVDDRLADGHTHPMRRVLVEPGDRGEPIADELHDVEHVERAVHPEPDHVAVATHAAENTNTPCAL